MMKNCNKLRHSTSTSSIMHQGLNDALQVLHFNVQGVTDKVPQLELLLTDLQTIDIMCITKHWLKAHELDLLRINNLHPKSWYTRSTKIRGGSCILVKNSYQTTTCEELTSMSIELDFECSAVKIDLFKIIVICIYRSPNGNIDVFFQKLQECLDWAAKRKICNRVIIGGDFNIDFMQNNKQVSAIQEILLAYNFEIKIKQPTRITAHSATCIDNFFINFDSGDVQVFNNLLSDHTYQILSTSLRKDQNDKCFYFKREFTSANIQIFVNQIKEIGLWMSELILNVNDAFNEFFSTFKYYFDVVFPVKKFSISNNSHNSWVTESITEFSREKNRIWHELNTTTSRLQRVGLEAKYKSLRNLLKTKVKQAKAEYFCNKIHNSDNKMKTSWNIVNTLAKPTTGVVNEIKEIYDTRGRKVHDPQQIANTLNDYFTNIASKLNLQSPSFNMNVVVQKSIFLFPATETEIIKIIHDMKNKSSSGFDEIPPIILKQSAKYIAKPLTNILNQSMLHGTYPELLKSAVIVPIFKKTDRSDCANYRPISLLTTFSKIFERAIYNRLLAFLLNNNAISPHQHGFIKHRSIDQAIFKTFTEIIKALNINEPLALTFLDLSKAFDTINIELLLYKLERYGIRGKCYEWLKSYLTNRKQCVKLTCTRNNEKHAVFSEYQKINQGVPQGSILGPLLFVVYVNDVHAAVKNKLILFADDTTAICRGATRELLMDDISQTLVGLEEWFRCNSLKMNTEKTQLMGFKCKLDQLRPNNMPIPLVQSDTVKFLGLYLDSNFKFRSHVDSLAGKLSRYTYLLYRLRDYVPIKTLLQVYYGYIHSNIRFGILFWGNSPDVEKILRAQKRAVRIIAGAGPIDHCKPLFRNLRILTATDLFILESALFVQRNLALFEEHHFEHSYHTRNRDRLVVMQTTRSYINNSVLNTCIRIYNTVPRELKTMDANRFGKELKKILVLKANYNLEDFLV